MTTHTIHEPRSNHAIFMPVKSTKEWRQLSDDEQAAFISGTILPILHRNPTVKMRYFDSDAYSTRFTDVVMWETPDLAAYEAVVDELRATKFWGDYYEVIDIVTAVESGASRHG
jgi:chlorite dismutase